VPLRSTERNSVESALTLFELSTSSPSSVLSLLVSSLRRSSSLLTRVRSASPVMRGRLALTSGGNVRVAIAAGSTSQTLFSRSMPGRRNGCETARTVHSLASGSVSGLSACHARFVTSTWPGCETLSSSAAASGTSPKKSMWFVIGCDS